MPGAPSSCPGWGAGWHGNAGASLHLLPPFPFTLLSLCEILPQKNREVLRARSDVRGEQARLCGALQGEEARPGLFAHTEGPVLSQRRGQRSAPVLPAGRGLHQHMGGPVPPPTGSWTRWTDLHPVPTGSPTPTPVTTVKQSLSP